MRSLALFLLLLNITFFTWQQSWLPWLPWQPEQFKPALQEIPLQANLPTLQLVGELTQKSVVTEQPKVAKETVAAKIIKEEIKATKEEIKVAKEETTEIKQEVPQETKVTLSDTQSAQVAIKTETPLEKTESPIKEENQSPPKKTEEKKVAVTEEKPQKKPDIAMACVEIGPYAQQAPAETGAKWFQQKHKENKANVERRETPIVTQTRVYLAPFKDKQEANLVQQRLIQQGITDHALFVTNDSKNAISLGVYSSEENAKKRVNQLKEKGYNNVQLEKQQKNDTKYWLSVKIAGNHKEVLEAFRKTFNSMPALKEITCQLPTS